MKICVLVKQVPNEDAVIKISPDGSGNHRRQFDILYQ